MAYDEDGAEWAAKLFGVEEDGEDEEWDEEAEEWVYSEPEASGLDLGILREIAMLRLLNGAHPNVMAMHDVSEMEQDGETKFCMIMKKQAGDLTGAVEKKTLSGKAKLRIAALALHALAWMHSHGVIHRDIKPDNLLLTPEGEPVLADFSLAKVILPGGDAVEAAPKKARQKKQKKQKKKAGAEGAAGAAQQMTDGMGTPTYTAPEIVAGAAYGVKADVFSMGIVLCASRSRFTYDLGEVRLMTAGTHLIGNSRSTYDLGEVYL